MAFLARVKPGILKKPGFLNLDAGESIFQKTGFHRPLSCLLLLASCLLPTVY